jgi:hypothetical protein
MLVWIGPQAQVLPRRVIQAIPAVSTIIVSSERGPHPTSVGSANEVEDIGAFALLNLNDRLALLDQAFVASEERDLTHEHRTVTSNARCSAANVSERRTAGVWTGLLWG